MNIAQIRRAAGAALIAALALAACSPGDVENSDAEGTTSPPGETPKLGTIGSELAVEGNFGEKPVMTWPDSDHPTELDIEVLHEGDGTEVAPSAHVVANYEGYVWQRAEPFDSSFQRGSPVAFPLDGVVAGWSETIPGHKVGSRLLITVPPEYGYGTGGNPNAGIAGTDTIVFVVDVIDTYADDAMGEASATPVELPADVRVTVEGALGEQFTVKVDEGAKAPSKPAVHALSEGSGADVTAGEQVVVSYALVSWDNSHTEASWMEELGPNGGPQTIMVGQGTGMDLLEGFPVGSRVLITQPATEGVEGLEDVPALAIVADIITAF